MIGISLASRTGLSAAELGAAAAAAERAGYTAVYLAEGGSDVLALCPAVIAATERVSVGTAIVNAHLHPPVLTAMTAATLAEAAGGRFVLGLGVANPHLNHVQLGLPQRPPLAMVEEYVAMVRAVHTGQPHDGEVYRLAAPLLLDRPAVAPQIHLAAMRPRMLELAGRIADGVILTLMSPAQAAVAAGIVRSAAAAAGRDPAAVAVSCAVQTVVSDDADAAWASARTVVQRFAGHASAMQLFAEHDAGEWVDGSPPDAVVDAVVAHGDPATCRARIEEYRAAGVDLPVVFPMMVGGSWAGVVETTIAAFAPADATPTR